MNGWTRQILNIISIAAIAAMLNACATSKAAKSEEEANPLGQYSMEQILEAGDSAYRQGEYDRAMFVYMQALELEATADNWYRVGITKMQLDDKPFAWKAFGEALRLDPEHARAHEDLGLLYVGSGQSEQAIIHLTKVTELDPTRWRAHNALGVIADVEKRYEDAINHYKAALEHTPKSPALMNNIGYSYYLSGDLQEATSWFDAAIQAQPGFELAIRNLALLYARQGWYKEAVETFIKVVKKPEAYNDVGYIAMRNGDYDQAGMLLTEAIRLAPSYYVTAYSNLETLEEMIKQSGERKERESLADNISEVVFAEDHETQILKVMPQALNVRAAPSGDSEIIDYLKTGDAVQIIVFKESWAFISYRPQGVSRDLTGWVKSRYLRQPGGKSAAAPLTSEQPDGGGESDGGPVGMQPLEDEGSNPARLAPEEPAVAADLEITEVAEAEQILTAATVDIGLDESDTNVSVAQPAGKPGPVEQDQQPAVLAD